MTDVKGLSDDELFTLTTRQIEPEVTERIVELMAHIEEGHTLTADESDELNDLKAYRDDFLRTQTRARLEAGMRGLSLPDN